MDRVRLDAQRFQALPWHDAPIFGIGIEQHDDGTVDAFIRCAIRPDEQSNIPQALAINDSQLIIWFCNTWNVRLSVNADTSQRECIGEWAVEPSPTGGWPHYHIDGTAGSTLDLDAEVVWLEARQ